MEEGVGDFMDGCLDRLDLAHAFLDHNLLCPVVVIAFCPSLNRVKTDRGGRSTAEGVHKKSVIFSISFQFRHIQFRERLAKGLRCVEHLGHFKAGNGDLHFLHLRVPVPVKDRPPCCGIRDLAFCFLLVRGGGNNGDPFLAPFHLTVELFLPVGIACHMCRLRHLHRDQEDVVGAVVMKFGHSLQHLFELDIVCHVLLHTCFKAVCDGFQLFPPLCRHFLPAFLYKILLAVFFRLF